MGKRGPASEDELFHLYARELHKVAPSIAVYTRQVMLPSRGVSRVQTKTFYCIGAGRFKSALEAIMQMTMAMRMVNHSVPEKLQEKVIAKYGASGQVSS